MAAFMERMGNPAGAMTDRASGEESGSFEAFFAAEHVRLLRALFLLTGSAEDAEELMQESFIAIWERWDRVSGMDEPSGYLYRTAMNRHRSRLRRTARLARRAVALSTSADAFAAADERDVLARALALLPPRQRAAIVLVEVLGFDAASAARILGVKDVTVRSLASQARASLRETLEGER